MQAYHAVGHALRRTVCAMGPAQPCETCTLYKVCVHTRLFETLVHGEPPPFLRGIPQAVRPYVFEPKGGAGELAPGDPLRFDLLLFGQAIELQAYALVAIERMAKAGLAAGRRRFRLVGVDAAEPSVPSTDPLPAGPLTLRFPTPLRIKVRERLAERFRFRDLAFNMSAAPWRWPTSTSQAQRLIGPSSLCSPGPTPSASPRPTSTGTTGNASATVSKPR